MNIGGAGFGKNWKKQIFVLQHISDRYFKRYSGTMAGPGLKWFLIFCGMAFFTGGALAQNNYLILPKTNSPYSRFGLGDMAPQYLVASAAMGGMGAAYYDAFHLNPVNPASLGWLQVTAFEMGLNARYSNLSSEEGNSGSWSGNLNYLALGFPLKNPINQALERNKNKFGWGMSAVLQPFSNVGYNIEAKGSNPEFGSTTVSLKGSGGTYRFKWGNGIRYGGLSAGVQLNALFGKITNARRISLDSIGLLAYSTELRDEMAISGVQWTVGAQYTAFLSPKSKRNTSGSTSLTFGAFVNNAANVNTFTNRFYYRDNAALISILDTVLFESETRQNARLPREASFGLSFDKLDKMKLMAEYSASAWSGYNNEARPETLLDSWRFSVGGEWIPDITSYNNYFNRLRYRAGFFYGTDPRSVNGQQIEEMAITLGAGFPIILPRQTTSFVNVALTGGWFGTRDNLRETFVQMSLGFTLNDNSWFYKRKFN